MTAEKNELNSMTMKQLVDFYNSFRAGVPNLPAITTSTYKTKAELITEICNTGLLRPKSIARMLKQDPYQVRQQLRAARADGKLGHVDWKHWNLSMLDFRRVFGKSDKR